MPRVNLAARIKYFSIGVINHWNTLAADTVAADSSPLFKNPLHGDLGNALFEYIDSLFENF